MMPPLERATGYALLGRAFAYPDPEVLVVELQALAGGPPALARLAAALAPHLELGGGGSWALEGEYNRLFATGVAVSPYETAYLRDDPGLRLGRLAALYEAFGARAGGPARERPDHIGTELEFAALLCLKEALFAERAAGPEPAPEAARALAEIRRARRLFAEEHLGRWASTFAARLAAATEQPFWRVLAAELARWVERDLQEHRWQPLPAPALPLEPAEPLDVPLHCPHAPPPPAP